jgi:predicted O-methyltransferase YrrM
MPSDATAAWLLELARVPDDPILSEMEEYAAAEGFPIVGPEVGRLLTQVARIAGARRVFELGSGFGYSALWFLRGMGPAGELHHTDGSPERIDQARDYLGRAGVAGQVQFHEGDAREALAATPGSFDVLFMDIDKHQYPSALELLRERVRVGGLVVVDNLLWDGKVAAGKTDRDTQGIRDYIAAMWNDPDFLSSLLPVRDGVGLSLRLR